MKWLSVDGFYAVYALAMPLGLGLVATSPELFAGAPDDWWGDLPGWIEAFGIPLAIFATVHAAQIPVREAQRRSVERQRSITGLALGYAKEVLALFDEAERVARGPGRQFVGHEAFDNTLDALRRFPAMEMEGSAALAIYYLINSVSFYIPRYNKLQDVFGYSRDPIWQKLDSCRSGAEQAKAILAAEYQRLGGDPDRAEADPATQIHPRNGPIRDEQTG